MSPEAMGLPAAAAGGPGTPETSNEQPAVACPLGSDGVGATKKELSETPILATSTQLFLGGSQSPWTIYK